MPSSSSSKNMTANPMQDQSDRAEALLSLSIALIDSAIDVLRLNVTTDEQLMRDSLLMPGGTIGKHMRHVIESYQAFLLPLYPAPPASASASVSGSSSSFTRPAHMEINYDSIHPTSRRPIARSVKACRSALEGVRDDLIAWGDRARSCGDKSAARDEQGASGEEGVGLSVAGQTGLTGTGGLADEMGRAVNVLAITPTRQEMGSTIGRELWYISLHAIHHFSMLRTIAVHEHGLELPVEFGTAPSTLLYRGLSWKPPAEDKEVRVAVAAKSKL